MQRAVWFDIRRDLRCFPVKLVALVTVLVQRMLRKTGCQFVKFSYRFIPAYRAHSLGCQRKWMGVDPPPPPPRPPSFIFVGTNNPLIAHIHYINIQSTAIHFYSQFSLHGVGFSALCGECAGAPCPRSSPLAPQNPLGLRLVQCVSSNRGTPEWSSNTGRLGK